MSILFWGIYETMEYEFREAKLLVSRVAEELAPIVQRLRRIKSGLLRAGDINDCLDVHAHTNLTVPLISSAVPCGLPSPVDDDRERVLGFNELLVRNPEVTFAVRVSDESMISVGLFPGDTAVVDRLPQPSQRFGGAGAAGWRVHRQALLCGGWRSGAAGGEPALPDIKVSGETSLEIWGVVKYAVRML